MTRVLVEVDGKAIYDRTFQDSKVSISSHRDVTALYKMGQREPYTLAPSRISQDVTAPTTKVVGFHEPLRVQQTPARV